MKSFITYLTERKDHIIKRLKNLTDDEKDQVIAFFNKKPNLENKIDWQNRNLTFKDFEHVMDTSKRERKKAVKKQGITGLKAGKDYLELKLPEELTFSAYIPLHHEASRLIGSSKIGGVATKWCISANVLSHWKECVYKDNLIPVMFVDYTAKEKYTLMLNGNDLSFDSFWDQKDNDLGLTGCKNQFGSDWKNDIVPSNAALLRKARTILDENAPLHWFEDGVKNGKIKVSNPKYNIDKDGRLVWEKGTWKGGDWKGGDWKDGLWKDGTWWKGKWEGGIWMRGNWSLGAWSRGTWKDGIWYGGDWVDGTWKNGTWHEGRWWGGTWENGTCILMEWKNGTWKDGTWKDGIWTDGTWENGNWENGVWYGGIWKDGEWEDGGIWKTGTWEDGTWKGGDWEIGTWKGGTWNGGTWKDGIWEGGKWYFGTWEGGTWLGGTWERGIWYGGTWKGGIWEGGYDKNGKYHEAGDSPDKWNPK